MKNTLWIITALALVLASCSTPEPDSNTRANSQVLEPSAPVSVAKTQSSPVQAPSNQASIVVAQPSEPTVDISSVEQLSSDVDVEGLQRLDAELKDLEDLS